MTQLPVGVSLAATWDPSLATEYGKVVGAEERAKGATVNLGPTVSRWASRPGWTATRLGPFPAVVASHQAVAVRFRVAVPLAAQPGTAALTARVGYRPSRRGRRGGVAEATATITIPAFTPAAGLAESWSAG